MQTPDPSQRLVFSEDFHADFKLGNAIIEPARNRVIMGESVHKLEPKVMDVLCMLVDHPGEVISRDRFLDEIWHVKFGADESLTRAVSLLRKCLHDSMSDEAWIETIPKRGYRLKASAVSTPGPTLTNVAAIHHAPMTSSPSPRQPTATSRAIAVIVLLFVLAFAITQLRANWGGAPTDNMFERSSDIRPTSEENSTDRGPIQKKLSAPASHADKAPPSANALLTLSHTPSMCAHSS